MTNALFPLPRFYNGAAVRRSLTEGARSLRARRPRGDSAPPPSASPTPPPQAGEEKERQRLTQQWRLK